MRKSIYKNEKRQQKINFIILKMSFETGKGASMARMLMGRYRGEWKLQ